MKQTPQTTEAVAYCGRCEIQLFRSARDVALLEHSAEHHKETDIDAQEMSRIQHGAEILSLAS